MASRTIASGTTLTTGVMITQFGYTIVNDGAIINPSGQALVFAGVDDALQNAGSIAGGAGANGANGQDSGTAGSSGATAVFAMNAMLSNSGTIRGGSGGGGGFGMSGNGGGGGQGGWGVYLEQESLTNSGSILGGKGGNAGSGTAGDTPGSGGGGANGLDIATYGQVGNTGLIAGGAGGNGQFGLGVAGGPGGAGGAGIYFSARGVVTNAAVISGGAGGAGGAGTPDGTPGGEAGAGGTGVVFAGGGTLTNAGFILGAGGADAVSFGNGASRLILDPGAYFGGDVVGDSAVTNVMELAAGIYMTGTLAGLGSQFAGFTNITVDSGAAWTLTSTDSFAGAAGSTGSNGGSVGGAGGPGGVGISLTSATLTNLGTVSGGAGGAGGNGADIAGGIGGAGGTGVTLSASATLINAGTILGGRGGPGGGSSFTGGSGGAGGSAVYVTSGWVTNADTGVIAGGSGGNPGSPGGKLGTSGIGVFFSGGGTLTNAGSIVGSAAVYFGTGASRLIVDPGAYFDGEVVGDAAVTNVVELATGGGTGALAGLGTLFLGFDQITVDAGASWNFGYDGIVAFSGGAGTLTNAGIIIGVGGANGSLPDAYNGLSGGAGASMTYAVLNNAGVISGGAGGAGIIPPPFHFAIGSGSGGAGGTGAFLTSATLINAGTIGGGTGGVGGAGTQSEDDRAGPGGAGGAGVYSRSGQLMNAGTGVITGGDGGGGGGGGGSDYGYQANGGSGGRGAFLISATLINAGTIGGGTGGDAGISTANPGHSEEATGGTGGTGVFLSVATLINAGTIHGGAGGVGGYTTFGIYPGGRTYSRYPGGSGGAGGAGVYLGRGQVMNAGTGVITGGYGGDGGPLQGFGGNGGAGVSLIAGTLTNAGTIHGGIGGMGGSGAFARYSDGAGGAGVYIYSGQVTNAETGLITGGSGDNSDVDVSRGRGGVGVFLADDGTLTNAGSIAGAAGADAVSFGTGTSRLIVDPGAVFSGLVVAVAYYHDVLELARGGGAGTLSGVGAEYQNFSNVIVDAGAAWTLAGTNNMTAGGTLLVAGSLTNTGTILGGTGDYGVVVVVGGRLTNDGTIIGGSSDPGGVGGVGVLLGGGGTLVEAGVIAGGEGADGQAAAIGFGTGASRLILQPGAMLSGGVDANPAYSNVLELASASGTGTLSGIGTALQGFGSIVIDPSANWVLAGDNAIGGGTTLTGNGDKLTLGGGAVAVSGVGALMDNTGELWVGGASAGELSIDSGGTVITSPGVFADGAVIADTAGAGGSSVNVTGAGSDWQVGGALDVGNASTGVLAITNGATVSTATLDAGVGATGAGVVTVSGPGADLTTTGTVTVGASGSGELSILDGANATIGGDLDIANAGTGTGNVDIEDTTGTITFGGNILVGFNGFGVFNIGFGVDYIQNSGGIIFGPDSSGAINSFADPSPFFSNSSPNPISIGATGNDQLAAYLFNSGEITIPNGHALTFETPTIYGGGSFSLGSGDNMVLNVGTVSAQTFTLGSNDKLTIGIDNLATIDLPASGTGPFTPEANPNEGDLLLGNFDGVIASFASGDTIDVDTYLSSAAAGTLSQNGSVVSVIEIADGATLGTLTFDTAANAAAAVTDNAITLVPCFAAGTRIETETGEVAVEAIRVGDRVRVLLGGEGDGFSEVIWVGRREVDCTHHPAPTQVWPIRVSAEAFGPGQPHSDLFLSPDHAVYVNDVLIPVKHLVNGTTIVQVPVDTVTYYHLDLPQHDVVLAEGLAVESYLDMRDGSNYASRPGPVRLYPDFSTWMWEAFGCAKLIVTGAELTAARVLINEFALERRTAA